MPEQTFYKILTHDLRPPLQGGDPLPVEALPYTTPPVKLDTSGAECAAGWHFVDDLATGFKMVGLWRDGRPCRVFEVEPSDDVLQRGNKFRASQITLATELDLEAIERGIHDLSKPFGRYRRGMVTQQLAWYTALGRPEHDPEKVEEGLRKALKARGLKWDLKRFDSAWAARAAQDAWAARAARAAWAAWAAQDAWAARAAWAAQAAWAAWDAWDAWAAWAAWAAWDARAALTVFYASKNGWIDHRHDLLTIGLRDVYHHGLGTAIPTGPNELGWAMDEESPSEAK